MKKRINKWLEKGIIDEKIAETLLVEMKLEDEKSKKTKIQITIYTIATLLIGFGVISFIAANDWVWELLDASDLLKIFLLGSATIGSFWEGYQLAYENKKYPKLGNALIILSSLLIGGTYALIGQNYNLNADNSFLMFIWLGSILPIAYIFKNKTINIISIVLFCLGIIFFYHELSLDEGSTWTIFLPVILGVFLYTLGNIPPILEKYNDFSLSYKITGLTPIFITLMILTCSVNDSYQLTSFYYLLPIIITMIINFMNNIFQKNKTLLFKIETVSIFIILMSLFSLLVLPEISEPFVMIIANALIIAIIAFGFNYGYKFENAKIIGLTNWFLVIYLIVNYSRWGWSYMDKSLFFILGGICLLALGIFLEGKKKERFKGEEN